MNAPHTIRCEEVIRQLYDFLDGEIDPNRHAAIEHHLDLCRGCFSRIEFERLLKRRLAELAHEPATPSLRRRVDALLDAF